MLLHFFLGVSTRATVYAMPCHRHKKPAFYKDGGIICNIESLLVLPVADLTLYKIYSCKQYQPYKA